MDAVTVEKLRQEERDYGLTDDHTDSKVYYDFEAKNVLINDINTPNNLYFDKVDNIYLKPGFKTPSEKENMSNEDDLLLRALGS